MGFLENYNEYAKNQTDAPEIFHDFVGLVVLSTVVSKHLYIRKSTGKLYPNLWVILIAPTSWFHKGTALRLGKNILRSIDENYLLPNDFTRERLIEVLAKRSTGLLCWEEFMTFAFILNRDYMLGTKHLLCELYDNPPSFKRELQKRGLVEIKNPCFNVLAASTSDWFLDRMTEEDMRSGFYPRFVMVSAFEKEKSFPLEPEGDEVMEKILVHELNELRKSLKSTEITFEPISEYERWSISFQKKTQNPLLSGFATRLQTEYCRKFCILLAFNDVEYVVRDPHLQKAIFLTESLWNNLQELERTEIAITPEAKERRRILRSITASPLIDRAELLKNSHLSSKRLTFHLQTLFESGLVEERFIEDGRKKKRVYCIVGFRQSE